MLRINCHGYNRILKRIYAAGLSRILDHMWKGSFGIISACRGGSDDIHRTAILKDFLKESGQGFIDFEGGYLYSEEGKPEIPVRESSVFLPNVSESLIKSLAERFDQESYIFGERGFWYLKETKTGKIWSEGLVEDTFESLRNQEINENYPFMSEIRGKKGRQFRLDPDLVERRKRNQEQISWNNHRVAFRLVSDVPCFYSISGSFRPRPPVCLSSSGISLSGICPEGSLLDCWLPIQEI